jgi:hypothetical protein
LIRGAKLWHRTCLFLFTGSGKCGLLWKPRYRVKQCTDPASRTQIAEGRQGAFFERFSYSVLPGLFYRSSFCYSWQRTEDSLPLLAREQVGWPALRQPKPPALRFSVTSGQCVMAITTAREFCHSVGFINSLNSQHRGIGMRVLGKFVAAIVSITMFVMPAATMPLHCMGMTSSGENIHPCHMMGMGPSSGDQLKAAPVDLSCCQVSAARPESITVPRAPSDSGTVVLAASVAFLSPVPAARVVREPFNWNAQSPGGPPQAILCTFLI